jgi:MerR family mercuric resistance operon transcriptional regulator
MVISADVEFTIGEMSRRTGCKIETIRYYERAGLMPAPPRSSGGYRLYGEALLKRLNFIRRGRELRFCLDRLCELLALAEGGGSNCGEVKAATLDHLADIERKIADLRRMAKVLKQKAAMCEGGNVPGCPILETLFDEN